MATPDAARTLAEQLSSADDRTVNTSMRIPVRLRDAAMIAVRELGVAESTTTLTVDALQARLETALMRAVLDEHYRSNPGSEPTLAEIALALAAQDGSPLAEHPGVVAEAAEQVQRRRPGAGPDDVLLWAEAVLATRAAVGPAA